MFSKDWLFKGPKESDPLLIPISNGIPLEIGIFQTPRLELVGEDPTPAVVLSFPFDCLVRKFATFVRRNKYLGYFILSSRLFENVRKRAEQRDEAHFTKLVDNSAIAENYYNQ